MDQADNDDDDNDNYLLRIKIWTIIMPIIFIRIRREYFVGDNDIYQDDCLMLVMINDSDDNQGEDRNNVDDKKLLLIATIVIANADNDDGCHFKVDR